jgi:hypothetical protein
MNTYTHLTVPCAVLDGWAHLPPEPLPAGMDAWDAYAIQARRAQIHLEMRMEMLAEEERRDEVARA